MLFKKVFKYVLKINLCANYLYAAMIQPQPQPQPLVRCLWCCYDATITVAAMLPLLRCLCCYDTAIAADFNFNFKYLLKINLGI